MTDAPRKGMEGAIIDPEGAWRRGGGKGVYMGVCVMCAEEG